MDRFVPPLAGSANRWRIARKENMITIPDSKDECDFCKNQATIRVHILFLCNQHASQLVQEISQLTPPLGESAASDSGSKPAPKPAPTVATGR